MKEKLGLGDAPLDGAVARVSSIFGGYLDGTLSLTHLLHQTHKAQYMFQYFLKVVSTQFRTLDGKTVSLCGLPYLFASYLLHLCTGEHSSIQHDTFRAGSDRRWTR